MCRISEPELQNLVMHLRVPAAGVGGLSSSKSAAAAAGGRRGGSNFYVVRRERRDGGGGEKRRSPGRRSPRGTTFTVFPSSGSVIATGLRHLGEAAPAVRWLAGELECDGGEDAGGDDESLLRRWEGRVVNSTHVGRVECRGPAVSACRVAAAGADKSGAKISLRSQFFPGVLIKWSGCEGAVNLFNNGKFIIVGARGDGQVREIHRRLCALMRECWTTFTPPTSCAWTAASCSTA
jgi:TATA-box binding protein (TBP) (component of TFIID and TFIIIB)